MTESSARTPRPTDDPHDWEPPSPLLAIVGGLLLLVLGSFIAAALSTPVGLVLSAVGGISVLVGAIALGVSWGLALRDHRR